LHQTVEGEAGFRGVAFRVETPEELEVASRLEGASPVEELAEPGGGRCVRFRDPDGFAVEIVQGRDRAPALPVRHALPLNTGTEQPRIGRRQDVPTGPAQVRRLGHIVLKVSNFKQSSDWYRSRFGFLPSDQVYLGKKENILTAFLRCDRGSIPVDHHTLLCVGLGQVSVAEWPRAKKFILSCWAVCQMGSSVVPVT
jgi:catechol 2,3-dioxygenase-like lactoylglutathione lyase family enzyme